MNPARSPLRWPSELCETLAKEGDWRALNQELNRILSEDLDRSQLELVTSVLQYLGEQRLSPPENQKIQRLSQVIFELHLQNEDWSAALIQWLQWRSQSVEMQKLQLRLRQMARRISQARSLRNKPGEDLPPPTPFSKLNAKVSVEDAFPEDDFRDQWIGKTEVRVPYLSEMNVNEVYRLLPLFSWASFEPGERIYEKSGDSDFLYILAKGKVLLDNLLDGQREIGRNEIFGDLSLFGEARHSARAFAQEPSDVLMIRREDLMQALNRLPQLKAQVLLESQQRLFRHVQKHSFVFRDFPASDIDLLWEYLIPLHIAPGQVLMEPEREADRFFVVLSGRLEVIRPGIKSLQLGAGHFVGERGFLMGSKRTAQVKSLSHCHVLECDRLSFEELCEAYPDLSLRSERLRPELERPTFRSKDPVID
ncbi:MAG: cyclic nucleotide-binding domain-containing protein [Bradymonadales bacterium]|nr:MAG: cyclic nucleotide-binding domain-containing protein [Bradymonadales bacterium]